MEGTYASETLKRLGIDRLDGGDSTTYGLVYGRDAQRQKTYAYEHTAYIKGPEVANALTQLNIRTDLNEAHKGNLFNFADSTIKGSADAKTATLTFSGSYYSTFTYDAGKEVYMKQHSGTPHVDGKTGNQLSFKNVFALCTSVYPKAENSYLMEIELKNGTGYYFTEGTATEVTWSKKDDNSPVKVYDSTGKEISVNVGKSYIGFIGNGGVKYE